MSYNIRNIREISNDPLTKFANQLAKKLSKFITDQQQDKLENKEDIYSDGQDVDVVLRFQSLNSTKYFDFLTEFYPPTEPDFNKVKVYMKGDNIGNELNDQSGFNNHGTIEGDPMILDGTPFDYGIHTGGTKSICLRMNRPTSAFENDEYISIPDDTDLQLTGIATGISYFIRFRIHSLAQQGSYNRNLLEKVDDSAPNNGVKVCVDTSGRLMVYIKRGGIEYNGQTATGTIAVNTVYEVFITYTVSGNVLKVYVNNVDKSLTDPGVATWHADLTDHDLNLFRRGEGSSTGYTYGDLYDFWLLKEKVVSATEVGRHYTNKWTLADIPFGQVLVANYWATYDEPSPPSLPSFTAGSFTDESFET